MKTLYFRNSKKQLEFNNKGSSCIYIVGTPGLGKSCFFAASKFLHDLKIKYLIKNPDYKDQAIFADNIKMFYFMPTKKYKSIKSSLLKEL
jgi:hypothetical protein